LKKTKTKVPEIAEPEAAENKSAIVVRRDNPPAVLPTEINLDLIKKKLVQIQAFQLFVQKNLTKGKDYGIIKGVSKKPSLWKPGAEKVIKLMDLAGTWEFVDRLEEWPEGGIPFFNYTIKYKAVSLLTDQVVEEGIGSANSMESKFRFRWVPKKDVPAGVSLDDLPTRKRTGRYGEYVQYRIESEDIASLQNSILKMAKKRAMVDAALAVGRLSDIFTQDLEDADEGQHAEAGDGDSQYPEDGEEKPRPAKPKNGKADKKPAPKASSKSSAKPAAKPAPRKDQMVPANKVESALKFIRQILKEAGVEEQEFMSWFFAELQPVFQRKKKDPGYSPVVVMGTGTITWNGTRGADVLELAENIKKTVAFMKKEGKNGKQKKP